MAPYELCAHTATAYAGAVRLRVLRTPKYGALIMIKAAPNE